MDSDLRELEGLMEWRWVDDKGRAMTNWKQGNVPPVLDLTDSKGAMHVELRVAQDTPNPTSGGTASG